MEKDLKKKIKLYDKLGASKFQKVVFLVERGKFKAIKKLFPGYLNFFDKYCDLQKKIQLKFAKTEKEKEQIKRNCKFSKMAMRKEYYEEKNRNYHMDPNKPTEIFQYLEWNKKIHKHGLIKNAIFIPILLAGTITNVPGALPLLILETLSAGVNFECINIQNYNLCRLKLIEKGLKRKEEEREKKRVEMYGDAAEVIYKSIEEKEELPTFNEIIDQIKTPEQLRQMRELFQNTLEERAKQKTLKGGI